jgi:hypothetical protein
MTTADVRTIAPYFDLRRGLWIPRVYVDEIRVPAEAITSRMEGDFYYGVQFLRSKASALLDFFELRWAEAKPQIGFRLPQRLVGHEHPGSCQARV